MKKFLLLGFIIFATIQMSGQKCGEYIDLLGIGIFGQSTATIEIPDWKNVDSILAEAVYKSLDEPLLPGGDPLPVLFSTPAPNVQNEKGVPLKLESSGKDLGYLKYVFRAEFFKPAPQVTLVIPEDVEGFYSFALYVYRKDGSVYSIKAGEMVHVFHNEEDVYDIKIDVPTSDHSRDILLRFGITELNEADGRLAIFTFRADGVDVTSKVESYDPLSGESYIVNEVLLEDVPGKIDEITMTMLSMNPNSTDLLRGGDSFIAGVVLADIPCEKYESELLCSFTQGFYGNAGGKACGKKTTSELLKELLTEELVMGIRGDNSDPGNSFTINKGDVECVLRLLPGGGPSKLLVGDANCEDQGSYESNKQGRLKNTLLAQGITLALNTRLSPQLPEFPVDGTEFVTMVAMDCMDPDAGGVPGTEKIHSFSPEVVDELPAEATIADLLHLVNSALGGQDISPLSLSQVADAAGLVNEAFDECVVVKGYAEITPVGEAPGEGSGDKGEEEEADQTMEATKGVTGLSEIDEEQLGVYPNPACDHLFLSIPSIAENIKGVAIYSVTGAKLMDVSQYITPGIDQVIEINVGHLDRGIYFIRLESAGGSVARRFAVQ